MFSLRCLSVSLREEERFEGPKKSRRHKSPFVQKERKKGKRKKEDEKKPSGGGGVGIRFGFSRPKAHKKLLSSFSLDASVEEN